MQSKKHSKKAVPTSPPITENLNETHIVEKSRPLVLMKEVPFGLGELKVLDTYLSRINARNPYDRTVRFSLNEYMDLMGLEKAHPERLEKYVDSLMQKLVTVPNPEAHSGWDKYTLFGKSSCYKDDDDKWWIELTCTEDARELFFNVESIGYIRYQLKNVLPLTSKYSVFLYIYLLDNRFRRSWSVDLTELREVHLRCNLNYYQDYKYFKRDILDKSLNEINEKTDLTFSYETDKCGSRRIKQIKFNLIKDEVQLPPELTDIPEQLSFDDTQYSNERISFLAEACDNRFSEEEMKIIYDSVYQLFPDVGSDLERYNYLSQKYHEFQLQESKRQIKHPFEYFKAMLK